MFTVRGDVVIETGDEGIVIEADRRTETISGVIQAIAHRGVIGYELAGAECLVEIAGVTRVLDCRID